MAQRRFSTPGNGWKNKPARSVLDVINPSFLYRRDGFFIGGKLRADQHHPGKQISLVYFDADGIYTGA